MLCYRSDLYPSGDGLPIAITHHSSLISMIDRKSPVLPRCFILPSSVSDIGTGGYIRIFCLLTLSVDHQLHY